MSLLQLRWAAPDHADLLFTVCRTPRESPFSPAITLQITGGKLLASAPYAYIGFDYDIFGAASLEIIFPSNRKIDIEIELRKLELHHEPPEVLDSFTRMERCLRYSIEWRLAPKWNRLERKLIMGDKFLDEGISSHWFIEFNLSLSSEIVFSITNCAMIRLKALTLETLFPKIRNCKSERAKLEEQLSDRNIVACEPFSCSVLPSLKEASIIAVARKPFGIIDTMQKMATYWAGRYGYRLESKLSARESFFCDVVFPDGSHFLYPNCCLKIDRGFVVPRPNSQHTVSVFQKDIDEILGGSTSTNSDVVKFSPSFVRANSTQRRVTEE